jgi:large subunit ribosomal protein L33
MAFSSQSSSSPVQLRNEWTGFDLVKIGAQGPVAYRRGDLLIISGCITTVTPTKNQAGWDLTVGFLDQRYAPSLTQDFSFLAPTSMSRYEGIFQNGTSTVLRQDGKLQIRFGKATNPMVLHMSGVCCPLRSSEGIEPTPIHIAEYRVKDWASQMQGKPTEGQNVRGHSMAALSSSFLSTTGVRVAAPRNNATPSRVAPRTATTMMARKKGIRVIVTLECTEARKEGATPSRYTTEKNRKNTPDKLELSKYNKHLRRHTVHREIK